jgi:hypothetical protein
VDELPSATQRDPMESRWPYWVELWFLNWLRPRLPVARAAQVGARLSVWFVGGTFLAFGMGVTAMVLAGFRPAQWPFWWLGGLLIAALRLIEYR